ncbi:MAG TPA: dihydrolipoamide acetyltransferase family protein [Solirubrobacterales bacterium]|nr:dihydrolipoamide acetyltransferase family protein [Solirubrobacterales bacterium]
MAEIVMPRLSDSMEEGTVLTWLKQVGDEVTVGEALVEIETDKANMAYESDVAGTLSEILVGEGETVAIGTVIAKVGEDGAGGQEGEGQSAPPAGPVAGEGDSSSQAAGESPSPTPPAGREVEEPEAQTTEATAPAEEKEAQLQGDGHRPKASPLARRIAKERGLDLSQLHGSGPGGRIVKADVEQAASSVGDAGDGGAEDALARNAPPSPTSGPVATQPRPAFEGPETAKGQVAYEDLSKTQQVIARRMAESKATAPHFYLRAEVDMSRAVEGRARLKAAAGEGEVVPSFNDMVVKACALALREHPRANGAYRDGRFELYSRVNVGVAVAAEDALVVPTVFDADRKGLRQIAAESRGLVGKVREGSITPPELSGATFTVSNLGMYGIVGFSAVINPPQAAILAVGAIEERPVVRDGELVAAHLMQVDLACDHRILYGAPAAEFLARVKALLEEPLALAL